MKNLVKLFIIIIHFALLNSLILKDKILNLFNFY